MQLRGKCCDSVVIEASVCCLVYNESQRVPSTCRPATKSHANSAVGTVFLCKKPLQDECWSQCSLRSSQPTYLTFLECLNHTFAQLSFVYCHFAEAMPACRRESKGSLWDSAGCGHSACRDRGMVHSPPQSNNCSYFQLTTVSAFHFLLVWLVMPLFSSAACFFFPSPLD